ncbi:sodium:solute symporter [Endozoicomonas sp.]|uniref:sodium:solute symporter family protein n=1 Tax=Endozoicomonas sp. TaxID=1892382 RepID=UPI002887EE85|nr:sodium:solute symporter family protein [Endozoicomonas sp.]
MPAIAFSLLNIAVYLLILIPICIKARRSSLQRNATDHYLANRSLGFMVLFLTIYATTFSGNILGVSGQAYRTGFTWVMFAGLVAAITTSFHLVVPKLRPLSVKHHFITPGDWIRYRFGSDAHALRVLVATVLILSLGNFLFAQLKAAGEIIVVMTRETIPYELGVLGFAFVILTYDILGGLRAVAWTDMIQGLIMLAGFTCLGLWIIETSGGMAQLSTTIARQRPESIQIPGPTIMIQWFSLMFLGGLSVTIYPQTLQRIFAASSDKALYHSLAAMGVVALFTSTIFLFTGWVAIPLFNLDPGFQADQVLPRLLEHWAASNTWNRFSAMMVLLAILAAIMSTADSVLLSVVSMIRHDLLKNTKREGLRYDTTITIILMALISMLALYRDITLWRLMELKLELLIQCFPAVVIALHWRKVSSAPVMAGLVSGLTILAAMLVMGVKQIYGVNAGLIALVGNVMLMGCVHFILKQAPPENNNDPRLPK